MKKAATSLGVFRTVCVTSVTVLGCGLMLMAFRVLPTSMKDVTYVIDEASKLSIAGTTNINSFDCLCTEKFGKKSIQMAFDATNKQLSFERATLSMKAASLDCDNSKMNEDMQEALESESYPYIRIKISGAQITSGSLENEKESAKLKADAEITIRNVTKRVTMDIDADRIQVDKYHFVCAHNIKLTDYGIEPPTALFGLVKVRNTITINFDLYTHTTN